MVLEATVICLDNSEWMRNGDYTPSRMEAQHDAINLICGAKTQSNPESTVGIVACGGRSPEVLVTLTGDLGKLLSSLHGAKFSGSLNFLAGLQVSQLVLKHRQNKNQHQRIVFFVGSPVSGTSDELVRLAKRLKKNNIAVDIINFGEEQENTEKLEAFIAAVNNNDNSHLVNIPPGPHILSDIIISSPIIAEDSAGLGGGGGGSVSTSSGGNDFSAYGGVDPSVDPELALALQASLAEARAQQESEARQKGEQEGGNKPAETTSTPTTTTKEAEMQEADDEDLMAALAMSMQGTNSPAQTKAPESKPAESKPKSTDTEMRDLSEDQEMELALQLSMASTKGKEGTTSQTQSTTDPNISNVLEDPSFINSVLSNLPGVDPNDETIKSVLASLKPDEKKDDKDKDKEKK